ncbi:MAG: DUF262 domain-containing protein [Thermoanaerobaculia bacterium]
MISIPRVFKVSDFLTWNRVGSLILSPAFQRRPVWPRKAKSLLIDTVVRGIPMPIIFLRERTNPTSLEPEREVVDGQQRLRTLISFVEPQSLKDFDGERDAFVVERVHNPAISGLNFSQLSKEVRVAILNYELSVHVLPHDAEDREVLQIFGRMNSTGFKLNNQELLNAEFFGAFKTICYQLAYEQLDRWRDWRVFNETDIARMLEVEETGDMILTMMNGVHGKDLKLIHEVYELFDDHFPKSGEVANRFRAVFDAIALQLGKDLPSSQFRRKPLFHTLFTFYYDLLFGLGSSLTRMKAKTAPRGAAEAVRRASELIETGSVPDDVAEVLRGATNHHPARETRLRFLNEQVKRARAK